MHRFIYTLALVGLLNGAFAQSDYNIYLQSSTLSTPENSDSMDVQTLTATRFGDFYYLILQFQDVPTLAQAADLAAQNITLFNYLPNYAYTAKIPVTVDWKQVGTRAILPILPQYKLSQALANKAYPAHALSDKGIAVVAFPYPNISLDTLLKQLIQNGFPDAKIQGDAVLVNVAHCCVLDLAGHPAAMYLETIEAPPQAEGWNGRAAQRVNLVSGGFNSGFDGTGIGIAIGDDGGVSHEDFKGRVTNFTLNQGGTHGDMTAGLAVGAGNLNPLGMGLAPNSNLYLYDINGYPHIENAAANLQQRGVVITSTSYGDICGGVYSQDAQVIDKQVFDVNTLLHCFSAGNSGEANCGTYGGVVARDGTRFGNITGGMKAGKNVMTVGNAEYNDQLLSSSSRGPTADGRIKPDICAHGQGNLSTGVNNSYASGGGTSAAAPSLAGTAALLYQAYQNTKGGALPSSGLIKALLLNTAEDLGNLGPDYKHGWGRVHAGRAMEALRNNWYLNSTIANGQTRSHSIPIPAGTRQVRVMVYWHDSEGAPNAAKALVNDLDIYFKTPNGTAYLPWVLSRTAHRDSLEKPAYRGTDRVNNVEQVTIDEPAAGNYTLDIKGSLVPRGPQNYFVVYYFVKDELTLTYPSGGEGFVPDETETIHWDAFGNAGTFSLEYSTNDGANWQFIASNLAANVRHFDWKVPKIASTRTLIRVSRNGKSVASGAPFVILPMPDFQIYNINATTAALRWKKVPGASGYDVFRLGGKHMEIIGSPSDTVFQLNNISSSQPNWYSVRARTAQGTTSRRAIAKAYQHQTCDSRVTLRLQFDLYPGETFWDVKDANGRVWASGGPYTNNAPSTALDVEICLPNGCYNLNLYDTYNDGMCCQDGQGSYRLTDAQGSILASGGQFGNLKTHAFCVQSQAIVPLSMRVAQFKNASCFGTRDGSITVAASGGTGSYTYRWNNGATGATVTGLAAGTYSVTASDGARQTITTTTISQPIPIQLSFAVTQAYATNNGAINLTASGGTPNYQFRWSNGATTEDLSNLGPSTYTVTVTDARGCTASGSQRIDFQATANCDARASNTRFEWIQSVRIGNFFNSSGNNGGYGDFKNLFVTLGRGGSYNLALTPNYAGEAFREFWRVWIDFNQDGDFIDAGEEVFAANGVANTAIGALFIPNNITTGTTKMRVSMRYGNPAPSCGTFPYGEVEDYTVIIDNNLTDEIIANRDVTANNKTKFVNADFDVKLFPNPARERVVLEIQAIQTGDLILELHDAKGILLRKQVIVLTKGLQKIELEVNDLPVGTYILQGKILHERFTERLVVFE